VGWAKFDDGFTDHPKVVAAGPWAELLAMRAVIYCARHETDGLIRKSVLPRLTVGIPSVRRQVSALIREELWEETDEGWLVHDFLDYHPSRADKDAERQAARERMRKVRANKPRTEPEQQPKFEKRSPYPDPTRTPNTTSASNGFTAFHAQRAAEAVRERKRKGLEVKSEGGLARTIQGDPDFVAESKRLWAHRDCEKCGGKGFVEDYAPGAGQVRVKCEEEL
jgi:hypothetical protein